MKKGQGWARRVTLENLADFAPWLRQIDDSQIEAAKQERKAKKVAAAGKSSPFRGVPLALPSRFRPKRRSQTTRTGKVGKSPSAYTEPTPKRDKRAQHGALIWSKTLAKADAQAPKAGSHPKGYMTFAKARRDNVVDVDVTTYFRNDVFKNFQWNEVQSNTPTWEAMIPFDFTIHGRSLGVHVMRLSHKPSRVSEQANVPTVLHWKTLPREARKLIRAGDYLSLFRPAKGKRTPFYIEIS
ncbi:MAG TPA: hypothetical protein VGW39_10725 [Chthoniobacterales bacterium]|nr:hypothetical protein [Chthoniobacterales bacterium]